MPLFEGAVFVTAPFLCGPCFYVGSIRRNATCGSSHFRLRVAPIADMTAHPF
jgi:hypothetical protein